MSWWSYVQRIAHDAQQAEIAKAAGVTAPTVSRWSTGKQGIDPKAAAAFARAYRRPVLEAFVAAGFLTEKEAKSRPSVAPTLNSWSDDDLLAEVRRRLTERNERDGAPNTQAAGSAAEGTPTKPRVGRGRGRQSDRADMPLRFAREPDDR